MRESDPSAIVVTIGTELVLGEIENGNATWLCAALTQLGVTVLATTTVPDDVDRIAESVRRASAEADLVVVCGGLGGTPDDVTRLAIARALDLEIREDPMLALKLRAARDHTFAFAAPWCRLPVGARPLFGAEGGAPGFRIRNIVALPGVPDEMHAMFKAVRNEIAQGPALHTWRRTLPTTEHRVLRCLEELALFHRTVLCGSYPRYAPTGAEVEIVLRCVDRSDLEAAAKVVDRFAGELRGSGALI
jgi:molybdenum cofactor synthesis domain-containing protein